VSSGRLFGLNSLGFVNLAAGARLSIRIMKPVLPPAIAEVSRSGYAGRSI
jgi:hypothetical protein